MHFALRHNSVGHNTENNVNFSTEGSSSKFSGYISKKYRILYQQCLNISKLEKKLILCLLVGATCFILVTLLLMFFGLMYNIEFCTKPGCIISATRLLEGMNTSVDPCDNFYEYVCGRWSETHMNLDETNSWFTDRTKFINYKIKRILEEPATSDITPVLQMKNFYKLCMDTGNLNRLGLQPIFQILDIVELPHSIPYKNAVKDLNLGRTLSLAQRWLNFDILIQLSTVFDSSLNTTLLSISPSSNELSFLTYKRKTKLTPEEYLIHQVSYMTAVMVEFSDGVFNLDDITREALKIILLETQLKMNSLEGNEADEYMTITNLQELMFSNVTEEMNLLAFSWQDYISVLTSGLNVSLLMNSTVHIKNPSYFQTLGTHLVHLKPISFQRFIWWKIIDAVAPHTTDLMRMHKYMFNQQILRGIALPPTRSSVCISLTKSLFNDAIAHKVALQQNLSEVSKDVNILMTNIKDTFKRLISNSDWINQQVKDISLLKVDSIKTFIGYPEQLLNPDWITERYRNIALIENDFIGSLLIIRSTFANEVLNTIHTSYQHNFHDRSWTEDPTEVNAYYSRDLNSIAIPSGILQYPFYTDGIQALNYGAIGSILGHELTHGFDNEGRNYDWNGKRKLTWNKEMAEAYDNRAKCFVDQYFNYEVTENVKVNGTITLAENIADNGGIKEAFLAYEEYISKNGKESLLPGFENFSHQQLLFISYANIWCRQITEISLKFSIIDEHSPNKYRVIGSLSNLPQFSNTWNCKLNSSMNPINKCLLW